MSDYETGVFRPYRFTSKVHLGAIQQDVPEGTIVEFDGSVMKWAGQTHTVPQLQAGILAGWLVPAEDTTSTYKPQPAGVRVRPAQSAGSERGELMQMEEASEEEQIVGSVDGFKEHQKQAHEASAQPPVTTKSAPPLPVDAPVEDAPALPADGATDSTPVPAKAEVTTSEMPPTEVEYQTPAPPPVPATKPETTKTGRKMEVISDSAGNEDASPVAKISTPAKQKILVTDSSAAAQEVSKLDNKPPPKAEKISSESQDIRSIGPDGATGDVSEAAVGDDLTDILPDAATTPVPDTTPNIVWDRSVHWRSRVQKAISEYGDNPAAIRQILSQETPNVAKHIRFELSRAGKQVE